MATYTTNLNLKKPAGSENVSIGDINNNMDTIDSAVGTLSDQIGSCPIAYYTDVTIGNVTLNASGYADISSYKPSGKNVTMATINTWSTISPIGAFTVNSDAHYVIGSANQAITGLVVRYYYKA